MDIYIFWNWCCGIIVGSISHLYLKDKYIHLIYFNSTHTAYCSNKKIQAKVTPPPFFSFWPPYIWILKSLLSSWLYIWRKKKLSCDKLFPLLYILSDHPATSLPSRGAVAPLGSGGCNTLIKVEEWDDLRQLLNKPTY